MRGFTLVELLVGVIVMLVMLSVARIGLTSGTQTAGREAEKIAAYLAGLAKKSDRTNAPLTVSFETEGKIVASFNGKTEQAFIINPALKCTPHLNPANLSDKGTKSWTYGRSPANPDSYYPNGAHIFASDTLERTCTPEGSSSTLTYNYGRDKSGNRYLLLEDSREGKYYVVITSMDTGI